MKKIFTLLILSVALTFAAKAANATYAWFLAGGGTDADYPVKVTTDASGNIFFANKFRNAAAFNGINVTGSAKGSSSSYDYSLFICKLNPDKTNVWKLYSNAGGVEATSIATTPAGDLIVTGTIKAVKGAATATANIIDAAETVTTFADLGTASADVQSFVAKFNSNGIIQWAKELNSSASKDTTVTTTALATDANGNVYLTGTFIKGVILPGTNPVTLTSTNSSQATFIAKLNGLNGEVVWTKTTSGGIVSEKLSDLVYGDDGYLYTAGVFKNNATTPVDVTLDGKTFKPSVFASPALIKLNTDGTVSYVQIRENLSTANDARVGCLTVKSGKAFIAGNFKGNAGGIKFAGDTIATTANYLNGYLAAFNAEDGSDLWQKSVISPAIIDVNGLAVGGDNNLYAFGGHYNGVGSVTPGDVDFGDGHTLTDATNKYGDLYLAGYNPSNGTTQEVHLVAKGGASETAYSLTGFNDKLYLAAVEKSAPLTFENNTDTYSVTPSSYDFVLVKYTVQTTPIAVCNQKDQAVFAYFNKADRSVVINHAENIVSAKVFGLDGRLVQSAVNQGEASDIRIYGINPGIYVIRTATVSGEAGLFKLIVF
ncbi:MAG: hypothetical protein VB110_03660 [Bacteroidales bacterium]|nr:hypothetical protein [Bacteroidales bacterium]